MWVESFLLSLRNSKNHTEHLEAIKCVLWCSVAQDSKSIERLRLLISSDDYVDKKTWEWLFSQS